MTLDRTRVRALLLAAEGPLSEGHANCGDDSIYFQPLVSIRIALAEDKDTKVLWVGNGPRAYVVRVRINTQRALVPIVVAGLSEMITADAEACGHAELACKHLDTDPVAVSAVIITHVNIEQGSRSPFARAIF